MKKTLVLLLLCTTFAYSQNTQLRQRIRELASQDQLQGLARDFKNQKAFNEQQVALFKLNNPLEPTQDSGASFIELQRVDPNSTPIYFQANNEFSAQMSQVPKLHNASGNSRLGGEGMVIGILDGDVVFDQHREFRVDGVNSRVKLLDPPLVSQPYSSSDIISEKSVRSHATHVAGTLVAAGVSPKAKGMAPFAQLYSYGWKDDYIKILDLAQQGLLVSNHSYGIAAINTSGQVLLGPEYFGTYNQDAVNFDRVGYEFAYFQSVVSGGNDRKNYHKLNPSKGGYELLLGISTAKNAIVVGAVADDQPTLDDQTYFSSYGPTKDLRVKPDIVAIGEHVFSSAFVEKSAPSDVYKDDGYAILSGTSMAAPVVTGVLTLWQQWAIRTLNFPYKAATVKALMIHTAKNMELDKGPSAKYGWGLIQAKNGVDLLESAQDGKALVLEHSLFENTVFETQVSLGQDSDNLIFTLVWSDPPGVDKIGNPQFSNLKDLVNDLDMKVLYQDKEFYPYKLSYQGQLPISSRGVNDVDNVEKVEVDDAKAGDYRIVITNKGTLVGKDQPFSLIVSNNKWGGLVELKKVNTLEVVDFISWPNPVEDILNIEVPKDLVFSLKNMRVFDVNGRLFNTQIISSTDRYKLNVQHLPKGLYVLVIDSKGVRYRTKFLKR